MSRKVCLLGGALRLGDVADIPDDAEIWVANEVHRQLEGRKPSRVFQLHVRNWREQEREYLGGNRGAQLLPEGLDYDCFGRNEEHVEYLRTCGVPVYGQQVWIDIPTSVRYPFEAVTEAVGIPLPPSANKRLWATSSFGYMAALALTEHVGLTNFKNAPVWDEVSEFICIGIELPTGTQRERLWEWPNLAYYLGLATGLGIKVTLPRSGTSLLSAPHYALGSHPWPGDADHWFVSGYPGVVWDDEGEYWRLGTRVLD